MLRRSRRVAVAGAVVLAASLTGSLAACTPTTSAPKETVTLAVPTLQNPFFDRLRAGARTAAVDAGVRLRVVAARNDLHRQARQLRKAVRNGSEAVLVNPVDSEDLAPAVQPVLRSDVPVIAVDREIEGADVESTITSVNVQGGQQAADAIAMAVDGRTDVLHLRGRADTSVSRDRGRGFTETLARYGNARVVATARAGFDRATARRLTARLVRKHPGVDAVFAENDQMALGAIDALGRRAGAQVKVVGYDGTPAALRAIAAGTMEATIAQLPEQIGRNAVEQAVTAIDGGPVAPTVPVDVQLVTRDNVGQYLP